MSGKLTHLLTGGAAGYGAQKLISALDKRFDSSLFLLGAIVGSLLGSIMPDIIDPPRSPFHRGIGHSRTGNIIFLGILTIALVFTHVLTHESLIVDEDSDSEDPSGIEHFLLGFGWGYIVGQISHLALDSASRRGLPF